MNAVLFNLLFFSIAWAACVLGAAAGVPMTGAAAVTGAVGGPLSFLAGSKAGAVDLADPVYSLAVIAAGWALLMPLLVELSRRFDGHEPATA